MCKKAKSHRRVVVIAVLLSILAAYPAAGAEPNEAPAQNPQVVETASHRLKTKITYSCTEVPIEKVLIDLAEMAGIDIVKSPKVVGNVTVKVTDVPLEEVFSNILAAHDYTYIVTENMVRVMPVTELALTREELVTRIYQITYADANEVAQALRGYVSDRGKIGLNKGTSHLIVTDTENKIRGIDKFIEQIDVMTAQVLVEVRIYDITSNEGFEFTPEWRIGNNAPLKADTTLVPDEVRTTEIRPTVEHRASEETSVQDQTTHVIGEERGDNDNFTETTDDTTTVTGSQTTTTEPAEEIERTFTNPPLLINNLRRRPFVTGTFDQVNGGTLRFGVLNDDLDIDFALSILHQQAEAKLLANPRVLVLDNQTANFEIVREIPYRELQQIERAAGITYTAFKNVGVQLKVTPHIARDGMVKLHIIPEFGVVVGLDPNGVPTVDTRKADTFAMIRDGQTIVMGGLRKKETTKDITKVPILADIPLLGGLFKSETQAEKINELVVFITTRIIREPKLTKTEKRQFDATEFPGPGQTEAEITESLDKLIEGL
jgi:type IV pilus assembly protein PilQ